MKNGESMPGEMKSLSAACRRKAERTALGEESAPAGEARKKILQARARELAREPEQGRDGIECIEIVEFLIARERYGIESSYVCEVCPLRELTPLPCTPPFVLGIMNVRGNIISVIDLRKFLDLPEKGLTDLTKVIVLQDETMEFGILADAILGSRRIPVRDLQQPIPALTGILGDCLKGVTEELLVVLDGGAILADRRIVVHEEV